MNRIHIDDVNLYEHTDANNRVWAYEKFVRNGRIVKESNWSRLNKHINENCFIISACRGERSEAQNKKATEELAKDLRADGLGFIRVLGGFIENKGQPDETEVTEESFFVPMPKNYNREDFFNVAIKLCRKYNQDSVLISMPGFVDFGYYNKNGSFDFSPGDKLTFNDDKVGEYFSTLVKGSKRNNKWAFIDTVKSVETEWLALRHPSSVPQSAFMKKSGDIF
jgi:hypothetical protein